ncbi:MAG: BON domain-containing protein [Holosporaceae bacterium]|jgi:osmotically-inducible protein OsmY|nr:BON domain-containing protein [Holosporaceae bacterium]
MEIIKNSFVLSLLAVTACDPVTIVIGGAAIAGTAAVRNEKGIVGSLSDGKLQTAINHHISCEDPNIFDRVELCLKHGTVVVIGCFKDERQRRRAVELVKEVTDNHNVVFDETSVQKKPSAQECFVDSNITARIKSSLAFDSNVHSLNYDVTTSRGVVYICGTAQSKFERDVVLHNARVTSDVKRVVAYIFLVKKAVTSSSSGV